MASPLKSDASQDIRLGLYCSTHFLIGMSSAVLGPTLPALAGQTAMTLSAISFLFALRALARLLGAVASGYLFDRMPGHPIFIWALLGIAVTMIVTGSAQTVVVVSFAFLIMGIAEALLDAGGTTLVLWSKQGNLGASIPTLHFAYSCGGFVAPLIIAQLIRWQGSAMITYYLLPVVLLLPLPVLVFVRSPHQPESTSRSNDATLSERHPGLLIGLLLLLTGLYVGIEASFSGWIYTYATLSDIATDVQAAYLTSVYWGLLSLGRLLVIPVSRRYPPRVILPVALSGIIASVLVIASAADVWIIALGTASFGLFMAPVFPTIFTLADATISMTGQVTSWFFISTGLAAMLFPWLVGHLFGIFGTTAIMVSVFSLTLVMTFIYVTVRIRLRVLS